MPALAVAPPGAHRSLGLFRVQGDDVDPGITQKPVDDILPSGSKPSLDHYAQLNPDGGGHQPDKSTLQVSGELVCSRLTADDRDGSRRVHD
jgi:hypothetical protein